MLLFLGDWGKTSRQGPDAKTAAMRLPPLFFCAAIRYGTGTMTPAASAPTAVAAARRKTAPDVPDPLKYHTSNFSPKEKNHFSPHFNKACGRREMVTPSDLRYTPPPLEAGGDISALLHDNDYHGYRNFRVNGGGRDVHAGFHRHVNRFGLMHDVGLGLGGVAARYLLQIGFRQGFR